jgi:hypothetical protein
MNNWRNTNIIFVLGLVVLIPLDSIFYDISLYCKDRVCIADMLRTMPQFATATEQGAQESSADSDEDDDGGEEEEAEEEEEEAEEEEEEAEEEEEEAEEEEEEAEEEEAEEEEEGPEEGPEDDEKPPFPSAEASSECQKRVLYTNSLYGVKIQHPGCWLISVSTNHIGFVSPETSEMFDIYVITNDLMPLAELVNERISYYRESLPSFQLIDSRPNPIEGRPAHMIEYNFNDSNIGMAKSMELVTKGRTNTYNIIYTAEPTDYSTNFSNIQSMIYSIGITN